MKEGNANSSVVLSCRIPEINKKEKKQRTPQNTIFKTHMAASDLSASEAQLVFPDREVLESFPGW